MYEGLAAEYITRSEMWLRDNDPDGARRAIQHRDLELLSAAARGPRISPLRRLSALFARSGGSISLPRETASHA